MNKLNILVACFLLFILLGSIQNVSAITGKIGGSRIILNLDVGEVARRNILIQNVNDVPLTINLSASGGLAENLIFEEPSFTLNPQESKEAWFTIFADGAGTTDTTINVLFLPEQGSGVGLSARVTVIAVVPGSGSELQINSPTEGFYQERRIQFNVSVGESVDKIVYIDNADDRPREKILCNRNCEGYGNDRLKFQSFRDGVHSVTFKALIDDVVVNEKTVLFVTDSKNPKILRTGPWRGFASGLFITTFREENPKRLTLIYGGLSKEVDIDDECLLERGTYICETNADLNDFDGLEISYYFRLEDVVGNADESREITLTVDQTSPVINSFDYSINRRNVEFDFDVDEENFDKIIYSDLTANSSEKTLCSKLKNGQCHVKRTFKIGEHNLQIKVLDKAGNSETREVQFVVE